MGYATHGPTRWPRNVDEYRHRRAPRGEASPLYKSLTPPGRAVPSAGPLASRSRGPHPEVVAADLVLAVAVAAQRAGIADPEPRAPCARPAGIERGGQRAGARGAALAGLRDRRAQRRRRRCVDEDHGPQREPGAIDRADHEVAGASAPRPRRHREALQRQERAAVAAVAEVDARAWKRRADRLLGVAIERVRIGGQLRAGERGGEARPQGARVADEDPEPASGAARREEPPYLARARQRPRRTRAPDRTQPRSAGRAARAASAAPAARAACSVVGCVHASTMPWPGGRVRRRGARHTPRVTARLHHDRITHGDAAPAAWLALTHGIYGAGGNRRAIARKLVERRPDWGVILVDLRQHGRSPAGDPPHTVEAAAADLVALASELGGIAALAGHSFGGKVALAARASASPRAPSRPPLRPPLPHHCAHHSPRHRARPRAPDLLLDASPSARPGALADLVEQRRRGARADGAPAQSAGAARGLHRRPDHRRTGARAAQWLATNLVAGEPALPSRAPASRTPPPRRSCCGPISRPIRSMLADYFALDL